MSDFEWRGADRGRDLAYSPRTSTSAEPTQQTTPAEHAEAAVTVAARAVDDVKSTIATVHAAGQANEPSRWHAARERVDKAVAVAKKQLARAEATADKAPAIAKGQLSAAREALAEQEQAVAQLGVPPTGWSRSEHDGAIHDALAAPIVGAVGPSFAHKESAVRAELAKLSPEQSAALARRLRTGLARLESYQRDSRSADPATRANAERLKPSDPIVEQFALLNVERHERLLQFLTDARHRHEAGLARAPGAAPGAAQAPSSNTDAESPSAVAARGVVGSGGSLPHASAIQAGFGKHDVSSIRAHVGGAAAEASAALDAEAYATGDAVGFAHAPDLHTAAHEAAHVVQQRAGVQLKDGIDGGGGDPFEQHADAVADAVVRGESAEPLLDAPPRGATAGAGQRLAVQRKATGESAIESPARRHERIALYVMANENPIRRAIYSGLRGVGWPDPAPRLTLVDVDEFGEVLAATLRDGAELATYEQVAGLLYPDDPEALFGPLVPATDAWVRPSGWPSCRRSSEA